MTASTPALTPTSYVVLGLLDACGGATSYELERQVAGTVGAFWSFPRSQLYSEPVRLAEAGLVTEQREPDGRRRRTWSITAEGRSALQRWLAVPTGTTTEIRDLGLLKLFFGAAAASPDDVRASALAQAQAHRGQLAVYEELARTEDVDQHQRATLRLGLAYEQAAVAFWDEIAAG